MEVITMEKDKKILLGIIGVILIAAIIIVVLVIKDNKKIEYREDALKFEEEYEALNNQGNKYNDKKYLELDISKDNAIEYATEEEIVKVLEEGSGVIYFGFPNCPWCRAMINPLLETAKENNVKKIYYLNILELRDSYKLDGKKVLRTKEGSDAYYKILDELADYLKDYSITDAKGKEYATGVKRLYAPTVVMVKKGEVKAFHEDVVESLEEPYAGLTEEQDKELRTIFNDMIAKYQGNTCTHEGC